METTRPVHVRAVRDSDHHSKGRLLQDGFTPIAIPAICLCAEDYPITSQQVLTETARHYTPLTIDICIMTSAGDYLFDLHQIQENSIEMKTEAIAHTLIRRLEASDWELDENKAASLRQVIDEVLSPFAQQTDVISERAWTTVLATVTALQEQVFEQQRMITEMSTSLSRISSDLREVKIVNDTPKAEPRGDVTKA